MIPFERGQIIDLRRAAVIAAARTWTGTPFQWEACVKKVGVDCGRFVAASFNEAGVTGIDISKFKLFPASWFLHHRDGEPSPFIEQLEQFTTEIETVRPEPADIVVVKLARDWAHSAIVVEWPRVISCLSGFCVCEYRNVLIAPHFRSKPMRCFREKGMNV